MALPAGGSGGRRSRTTGGVRGWPGAPSADPDRSAGGRDASGRRGRRGAQGEGSRPDADADPAAVARQICLHQLEHAPRTRAELASVLARREVPQEVAEHVLDRLTEVGMVDDALFAEMWVASRHRGRGLAGRALSQELRRKGVDDEVVREAVEVLDPDQELRTARELVARRLPATHALAPEARVRRLAGLLARKGYPAGTSFRVVREALAAEGVDPDVVPADPELGGDCL